MLCIYTVSFIVQVQVMVCILIAIDLYHLVSIDCVKTVSIIGSIISDFVTIRFCRVLREVALDGISPFIGSSN